jgi:hypothetical protein
MCTIHVTSEDISGVKTEVVVDNGLAKVPPTVVDFDYANPPSSSDVLMDLAETLRNATEVLNSLSEHNFPTLQDRWTLSQAHEKLFIALDALEEDIVFKGLWLSRKESDYCEHWDVPIKTIPSKAK